MDHNTDENPLNNILNPLTDFVMPDLSLPKSKTNPAAWAYDRIADYINKFEDSLDDEHEIGARLVSFGSTVIFHIIDIGYWGPDIITFDGLNDKGEKIQLIQNVSQLSILLVAMNKMEDKPRRIGFQLTKSTKE